MLDFKLCSIVLHSGSKAAALNSLHQCKLWINKSTFFNVKAFIVCLFLFFLFFKYDESNENFRRVGWTFSI